MATAYPTALDNYSDPAATDALTGHAGKHTDLNDAVEALEAKVGVNGSAVATSLDARTAKLEKLGKLGFQQSAAAVSVTTAASIVNSVSVTVGAGRLVKITTKFMYDGDGTAGAAIVVRVNRSGVEVDRIYQLNDTTGVNNIVTVAGSVLDTPAAGTYTYEIDARASAGGGSVVAINHFILVEDVGSA